MKRLDKDFEELNSLVGKNLRLLRLKQNISTEELAAKLKVSCQQLYKYEKGANRISAGRLAMISQILAVPIEYFFEQSKLEFLKVIQTNEILSLKLLGSFAKITDRKQQVALYNLVKTLTPKENGRSI